MTTASQPSHPGGQRTLLLLRHAEAVAIAPGRTDADRPLTPAGQARAEQVGRTLAADGIGVDLVVCSPALRTRQTAQALGLTAPLVIASSIYNAGSDAIVAAVAAAVAEQQALGHEPTTVLVVGHAPGVPVLAHDLADLGTSSPAALNAIERGYPPATLCRLEITDPWHDFRTGRLVSADTGRH